MNSIDVVLLLTFPRSGGTVFSKALQQHSKINLISEVHSKHIQRLSLKEQLKNWFNLDSKGDYESDIINFIECSKSEGKTPVIRDFSYLDFCPDSMNDFSPIMEFTNLTLLKKMNYRVYSFALVRNGYDMWISQNGPRNLGKHYLNFIQKIQDNHIPTIKYEDFCLAPDETFSSILSNLDLKYEKEMLIDLKLVNNITGDISIDYRSRGYELSSVTYLKRKPIPLRKIHNLLFDKDLGKVNKLLSYPEGVLNAEFENKRWRF